MARYKQYTVPLDCCALGSLTASEYDHIDHLRAAIDNAVENYKVGGITTLQVVVTKGEPTLEKNLRKLGFRTGYRFKRRRVYDKSYLKVMILDLETYVEENQTTN